MGHLDCPVHMSFCILIGWIRITRIYGLLSLSQLTPTVRDHVWFSRVWLSSLFLPLEFLPLESLCKQLELLFTDFRKRCSNSLQRDPNDIFALKDKEKIALKIGPAGFSIFCLVFEYSLKTCLEWQK